MIATPEFLIKLSQPWADFYSDSKLTETLVTFAHVGALLVGGGIAIAADRKTLRTASDVERKRLLLEEVSQSHRAVIISLVVVVLSGVLLFASDVEAHWGSWIFWTKMALVVLLLANGARMRGIERRASADPVVSTTHWSAFRLTAMASLALWLVTTLAGVALINYA